MHCPSCGSPAPTEQKFCRSCGFDLKPISQLVAGTAEVPADGKWLKTLKWVVITFSILVVAALTLFFLPPSNSAGGVGLSPPELAISLMILAIVLAVPAVILLLLVLKPRLTRNPLSGHSPKLREQQVAVQTGKTTDKMLIEPSLEVAASITEDTTRQLEEAKRQNKS